MHNKLAVCVLLLCSSLFGETLQGIIEGIKRQANGDSNPIGAVQIQAFNEQSQSTVYTTRICIYASIQADGFCTSNYANSTTTTSNASANGAFVPGTYGSINVQDGNQYYLYPYVVSQVSDDEAHDYLADFAKTGPGATCCGWPYRWDVANNNLLSNWNSPNLSVAYPATAAQFAIWVDTNQTYSVGSSGSTVCTSGTMNGGFGGSTNLLSDGVVGHFVSTHSIPCANVYEVNLNGYTSGTNGNDISVANFDTVFQTLLNGLPSTIQYNVIGWLRPDIVINASPSLLFGISGWFAMFPTSNGVIPSGSHCANLASGLGQGPWNPWFNSGTNTTPLQSASVRPSIMLAAGVCPSCTTSTNQVATWNADVTTMDAVIDAATAAIGSNPSGMQSQTAYTNDATRNEMGFEFVPALAGNAISSKVSNNLLGSHASETPAASITSGTLTNNLMYFNGAASWNYDNTFGFKAGVGFWTVLTSYSAAVDTGQTPWISALGGGTGGVTGTPAVLAGGLAVEPCESAARKLPDPNLFQQYYLAGWDGLQAYWKSQFDPWFVNLSGDPMAQPFSASALGSQTISFGPIADRSLNEPPFALSATASSGLPVGFSSITPAVCTVSGSTVTVVTVGTCSITAGQTGDTNYLPAASVTESFTVTQAPQSIAFGPLNNVTLGVAPFTISATASSGLPVGFSSATTAVCTVSGNTVTIVSGGLCTILASQPGNAIFAVIASVPQSFTVNAAPAAFSELGIFRAPSGSGGFWLDLNQSTYNFDSTAQFWSFGSPGDQPVAGDWTGNGVISFGVFRQGVWYIDLNNNGVWDGVGGGDAIYHFGQPGDIAIPGDWNGSGVTKLGVFRCPVAPAFGNCTWFLDAGNEKAYDPATVEVYTYGETGDLPVVNNWNGTGMADQIGVFRCPQAPAVGPCNWIVEDVGDGVYRPSDPVYSYGQTGDLPVVGNWSTEPQRRRIGVFRGGTWFLETLGTNSYSLADTEAEFGQSGDLPLAGSWIH